VFLLSVYTQKADHISDSADLCGRAIKGVGLRALAYRDCEFECRRSCRGLSVVRVVCCQVVVSASGRSLVQRSVVGLNVILKPR